jgi:ATPase subunit of ABC transporter with duplicated ATPase domains
MLVCFEMTAKAVKQYREDCAEAERQRIEEQKQAERRRRQEAEYDRKTEVVSRFAQRWREANQLREFAAALKESARSPAVSDVQKLGILRLLDWIERHANYADPLTDATNVIREFDSPRWQ